MDERQYLILVRGENRTKDITDCEYNPETNKYIVTFSGGKSYPYNSSSITYLKKPQILNAALYQISHNGKQLYNLQGIYEFQGDDIYWHIVYGKGYSKTCRKSELEITESCLSESKAVNRLNYLKELASINDLKSDDGEILLKKQYEKLTFVGTDSVLANYLYPDLYQIHTFVPDFMIFPFGGNASQFHAVENALSNQISVIQGPPGTGKTQTILNIIANLLIQGKTVQIVSNNNSATENVLEKLSSPKYGLGFLVAALGKSENKQKFIADQTGTYPDLSSWSRDPGETVRLREQITTLAQELSSCFKQQERLACAKQELSALETEAHYFNQYYDTSRLPRPSRPPRKRLESVKILRILQECEAFCENEKAISFWHKVKTVLFHGIFDWKFYKNDTLAIIAFLQSLFYLTKHKELTEEIVSLEANLAAANAKTKMDELTSASLDYLRAILYSRYGGRSSRDKFTDDTLWRTPGQILREYPIILSTTFSSKSSLKDITYDYIIMDEASQVDIATGALALSCARNAVIVGDLKQLPNVISNHMRQKSEMVFSKYQLPDGYSFADNSFLKSVCSVIPNVPQTLLREHYRCHPKIIGFCNQKFYHNQLIIMTDAKGEPDALSVYRTNIGNHKRGHINQRQIDVTVQEVLPNLSQICTQEIGIIAPYRDQVNALSNIVPNGIEYDTVHKFQGREKDTIILTTVDDEVTDFSDDPYLLNVAISRAKKRLCLVASGNNQPKDSNIQDLISYIQYNNFEVIDSSRYSVFDLLYQQYTAERLVFLQKHKRVSQYDSENLMYAALRDLLQELSDLPLEVCCHQQVRLLIRDFSMLSEKEAQYASHPGTHVDFLIYNRITKVPVLAIEVDGFHYHKTGTAQAQRDQLKDSIFAKYKIPLLRLPTNGSSEIEKVRTFLLG